MALTVAVVDAIRARLAAVPAKEASAREVTRVEAVTRMRGELLALRERGYSWEEVAALVSSEGCRVAAATLRTELSRRGAAAKGKQREPARLVESDASNPDVYKAYRAALPSELVDLDHVDGWIQVVNTCDANRDKAVVVNTPARSATGVAKFGSTLGSSLPELGRVLIGLWAINRHRD